MADHPPEHPDRPPLHPLLDAAMLRRLEQARQTALARADSPHAQMDDMRSALLARYPALPLPMIDSALAAMEPEGRPEPPRHRVVRRFARRLGFRSVARDDAP